MAYSSPGAQYIYSLCKTLTIDKNHKILYLEPPIPYPYEHETTISDHYPEYYSGLRMQNDKLARLLAIDRDSENQYIIYRHTGGEPAMICRFPETNWGVDVWSDDYDDITLSIVKFDETSWTIIKKLGSSKWTNNNDVVKEIKRLEKFLVIDIEYKCINCGGNGIICDCPCDGCRFNLENQLGHMEEGGCLCIEKNVE